MTPLRAKYKQNVARFAPVTREDLNILKGTIGSLFFFSTIIKQINAITPIRRLLMTAGLPHPKSGTEISPYAIPKSEIKISKLPKISIFFDSLLRDSGT